MESYETYDAYDRITAFAAEINAVAAGNVYEKSFTYASTGNYSSYLVSGESFSNVNASDISFAYTYDARGNLTSISEGGVAKQTFSYDDLNQLIREDNAYSGKTYLYSYDGNGNILTKDEYSYTLGTPSGTHVTKQYSYGDSQWKDLLTSYCGQSISYDSGKNPINWRNASSLSWTGKTLDSANFTGTAGTVSYKYDSNGLRTRKIQSGDTAEYFWDGSDLITEVHQNYSLKFIYKSGEIAGFTYIPASGQSSSYYYGIDNFGVIKLLFDENGNRLAEYTYDAWGVPIGTTTYYNDVGVTVNPIRYKGYYYDNESGFYYLQSRYYDPVVGRFISADTTDYLGASGTVLAFNLFAYCENNPINKNDFNGHIAETVIKFFAGMILGFYYQLFVDIIESIIKIILGITNDIQLSSIACYIESMLTWGVNTLNIFNTKLIAFLVPIGIVAVKYLVLILTGEEISMKNLISDVAFAIINGIINVCFTNGLKNKINSIRKSYSNHRINYYKMISKTRKIKLVMNNRFFNFSASFTLSSTVLKMIINILFEKKVVA